MSVAAILTPTGLLMFFLLSKFMAHYTVVYRRNNLAVAVGVIVSALAFFMLGWLGLLAYVAGTMVGAWQWVAKIRRANEQVSAACACITPTPARAAVKTRRPERAPMVAR
jgi:TctA family transporter